MGLFVFKACVPRKLLFWYYRSVGGKRPSGNASHGHGRRNPLVSLILVGARPNDACGSEHRTYNGENFHVFDAFC